ncbi:hypothetical protein ILYODFUR_002289 [Ilyodon furcidens]|uniref:Uncharacterized protein n=1 Tax=Ilyodon furcidens TaxID=33524 RepID=A0ABV0SU08_9TELE
MDSDPLQSSSRLWDLDFSMRCKLYFHLKTGSLSSSPIISPNVRRFCFWFRIGFVCSSQCTNSSLSPLLVKLQIFEWILLDNPLKAVVLDVAGEPFCHLTFSFHSSFYRYVWIQQSVIQQSVNAIFLSSDLFYQV